MKIGAFFWNIEKQINKGDYYYAKVPNHPNAIRQGYVLYHRIVMENHLGRLLNANEVVHHVNGNKKDNRLENLKVMDKANHTRMHQFAVGRKCVNLRCPQCNLLFNRELRQTHVGKKSGNFTCCSRSCRGKLSRFIQLNGITKEVEKAISGNILNEYKKFADNPEATRLFEEP
jgi:hypothetical protein